MLGKIKDFLFGDVTCSGCGSRKAPDEISRKAPTRIKVSSEADWAPDLGLGLSGAVYTQVTATLTLLAQFKCPDCGRAEWKEIKEDVTEFEGALAASTKERVGWFGKWFGRNKT